MFRTQSLWIEVILIQVLNGSLYALAWSDDALSVLIALQISVP